MDVLITEDRTQTFSNLGLYRFVTVQSGSHTVSIMDASNAGHPYVQVIVESNASHKAWRGMGRKFNTLAAAIAHYKTPAIKAALQAVAS